MDIGESRSVCGEHDGWLWMERPTKMDGHRHWRNIFGFLPSGRHTKLELEVGRSGHLGGRFSGGFRFFLSLTTPLGNIRGSRISDLGGSQTKFQRDSQEGSQEGSQSLIFKHGSIQSQVSEGSGSDLSRISRINNHRHMGINNYRGIFASHFRGRGGMAEGRPGTHV